MKFTALVLLLAPTLFSFEDEDGKTAHKANRLAQETSPYLRQHGHNPVDWYPWGEEALQKARDEDKPIFLSIGYSACHWCHVMEHESFEDEAIAKLMNDWFVCIKVDREERPDIDEIYMDAVVEFTGRGGWPMSVFMTPDLEPFFGGTYFPPRRGPRGTGFDEILTGMHKLWTEDRDKATERGRSMVEHLRKRALPTGAPHAPDVKVLARAVQLAKRRFDPQHGGFANAPRFAPKFPHASELQFLLWHGTRTSNPEALRMVRKTLDEMARGGIYDQVGGGFARYSVDRQWTVPHFEKMLYDNAQLAVLYLETWQATGEPFFRRIAREILDYELLEMTGPEGGFYSTTDADSEGEEGKFFVWGQSQFDWVVGEHSGFLKAYFGVTQHGNFEGHNILTARKNLPKLAKKYGLEPRDARRIVREARAALYAVRKERVHPLLDDKILSSWNGLMLTAYARAAQILGDARYLEAARANARFLLTKMRAEDGSLHRTRRLGRSRLPALLEDYAFVTRGLTDLYEADGDPTWIEAAIELHEYTEEHFADELGGGYFSFSDDHEKLPVRTADASESSLPSDIGVAAMNAARLGMLSGRVKWIDRAHAVLARYGADLEQYPNRSCQLLLLMEFLEADPVEAYVVGDGADERVATELDRLRRSFPPYRVIAHLSGDEQAGRLAKLLPAAEGKSAVGGEPTVYECYGGICLEPRVLAAREQEPEDTDE